MALADQLSGLLKKKPQDPGIEGSETISQESSQMGGSFDTRALGDTTVMVSALDEGKEEVPLATDDAFAVPLLGTRSAAQHQRILSILLAVALVVLAAMVYWTVSQTDRTTAQVGATGQSLMQSQRLAKSVSQALIGGTEAFTEVKESSQALARDVHSLQNGGGSAPALGEAYAAELGKITPLVDRAEKNAAVVLEQQQTLTQVGTALRAVSRQSSDLLEVAETVSSLKLQQGAPSAEIAAGTAGTKYENPHGIFPLVTSWNEWFIRRQWHCRLTIGRDCAA